MALGSNVGRRWNRALGTVPSFAHILGDSLITKYKLVMEDIRLTPFYLDGLDV